MEATWSLDILYRGNDDPALAADLKALDAAIAGLAPALQEAKTLPPAEGLTLILKKQEETALLLMKLFSYLQLRQSADANDNETMSLLAQVSRKAAASAGTDAAIHKYIASLPEETYTATDFLKEYAFLCGEIRRASVHLLSEEAEEVVSRMDLSGAGSWSQLFDFLTSNVEVSYRGETITLSEVRNLAYSPDQQVRKDAYEAELKAYDVVKVPIAFALNSIKNQVTSLTELRGYASPLQMTLEQTRMKQETLDAMFTAMREYFPAFRRYMRAKARLLGHEGGLPWYEIFAPVGEAGRSFTIEEAGKYLQEVFSEFAEDSAALMKEAFENRWIDFLPRAGKVGGAFCAELPGIDQSRILTNFSGDFDSVNTLAHELGHAYHNRMLKDQRPLNNDYPMQIAETASTFNEVHFSMYAIAHCGSDGEKLRLLEHLLSGANQTICDIYSRFLFEDAVFNRCSGEFLMPDTLCEIMTDAQKEAYGDGLDPETLHPYMWCCKGHYYSGDLSYYNFPYAFGCMLSMGLYAQFREKGQDFLPGYRAMLAAAPVKTLEELGQMAGIDLSSPDFWRSSLQMYAELSDEYCRLAEAQA